MYRHITFTLLVNVLLELGLQVDIDQLLQGHVSAGTLPLPSISSSLAAKAWLVLVTGCEHIYEYLMQPSQAVGGQACGSTASHSQSGPYASCRACRQTGCWGVIGVNSCSDGSMFCEVGYGNECRWT